MCLREHLGEIQRGQLSENFLQKTSEKKQEAGEQIASFLFLAYFSFWLFSDEQLNGSRTVKREQSLPAGRHSTKYEIP